MVFYSTIFFFFFFFLGGGGGEKTKNQKNKLGHEHLAFCAKFLWVCDGHFGIENLVLIQVDKPNFWLNGILSQLCYSDWRRKCEISISRTTSPE